MVKLNEDKEYSYAELSRLLSDNNIETLRVKDTNDRYWLWKDGNFVQTMKEGDTEPPYIYMTDIYNLIDLYNLKFHIPYNFGRRYYSLENIIEGFSHEKDKTFYFSDEKNDNWEFVPLKKSLLNENGESILEFYNDAELSMKQFELLYIDGCLPKTEVKSISTDLILKQLDEVKTLVNMIENEIKDIKEME